jgi:hypothetical protein
MKRKDDLLDRVRVIQASMLESARPTFTDSELDHLRCMIRLAVEFYDYLESVSIDDLNAFDLQYAIESTFSGIDSFTSVSSSYKVLVGASSSKVKGDAISAHSLKEMYVAKFHDFRAETNPENKLRFLLDLFKLQIIFAGMLYG